MCRRWQTSVILIWNYIQTEHCFTGGAQPNYSGVVEKYSLNLISAPVPTAFLSAYVDIAFNNLLGSVSPHIRGGVYKFLIRFSRIWISTLYFNLCLSQFYISTVQPFKLHVKAETYFISVLPPLLSPVWSPSTQLGSNSHDHTAAAADWQFSEVSHPCWSSYVTWAQSAMP